MTGYIKLLLGFSIIGLALVIGANAALDPFRIYHDPLVNMAYSHIERYRVPGQINESLYRHKDADTILIGTSMSDNTDDKTLAKAMDKGRVLKLIFAGGLPNEHRLAIDYALGSTQVNTVLWEIHSPYFHTNEGEINAKDVLARSPWRYFPTYLYDRFYANDFSYLLSADSLKNFKRVRRDFQKGRDNLQGWGSNSADIQPAFDRWSAPANKESVKAEILKRDDSKECPQAGYPAVEMIGNFIRQYPEVDFILYIPPLHFSAYAMQSACAFGTVLAGQQQLAKVVFELENAKLYAYDDHEDIVLPFANYKDSGHYAPAINMQYMTALARGQGEITPGNIDRYFAKVRDIYETGMARSDIDKPAPVKP